MAENSVKRKLRAFLSADIKGYSRAWWARMKSAPFRPWTFTWKQLCWHHVISDILIYFMGFQDKPLVWMHGEITTPPFSETARIQAGYLLRQLQKSISLSLPQSRPMPSIGVQCHELRINDKDLTWRIIYRIYNDAILILEVFQKKTNKTPKAIIDICKKRINRYAADIK